jgi:TIR domain
MQDSNSSDTSTRTVLISYSHDDSEHKEWVRQLADKLVHNGVSVWLDQYDLLAGDSPTYFMESKASQADKVILILTPIYKQKADERKGGVGYEHAMVALDIYGDQLNRKVLPVIRRGNWNDSTPIIIKALMAVDMTQEANFEIKFTELLYAIHDQPLKPKPSLGKPPVFGRGGNTTHGHEGGAIGQISPDAPVVSKPQLIDKVPGAGAPLRGNVIGEIINASEVMSKLGLSQYAKWTFEIGIPYLMPRTHQELDRMLKANAIRDEKHGFIYPFIFNGAPKSDFPVFHYSNSNMADARTNLVEAQELVIDRALIHYEFCELTNMHPQPLHLMTPFTSLLYLLWSVRRIEQKVTLPIVVSLRVRFSSSDQALLKADSSPVMLTAVFGRQNMTIPNNSAQLDLTVFLGDDNSLFQAFSDLYGLFVSPTTNALRPYLTIERPAFDDLIKKLNPSDET